MSANTAYMGLIGQSSIISFVIPSAHDMEFLALKMLILMKFHLFISNLLNFIFCVLFTFHSNSENHSCNFLKFHESITNIMRICLLWASPSRIPFMNIVIHVQFWGFIYVLAYWQIGINSCS